MKLCQLRKNESTYKEVGAEVPSTTYFAIRESDHKLVGIIDLRHHINHPLFSSWAGHCGCSVRPSERGRGYAKEMLRLNLINALDVGIDKILVTCLTENHASENTILANNGIFENTIEVDGFLIKRYWIKTKPSN
ncbi:MAG: GNAT family N-acetyltransferase [Bacilli bacterium]|nr:GNAT family N-acetyltransferase [Bacilli bacterium]